MSAYTFYLDNNYPEAISGLQRFIQLHPAHKDTAYAYYLKALSYYEQITDVGRDQEMTQKAVKGLRDVVMRFPKTEYARDSRLKLDLTIDHLAGKQMNIGRYYQGKKQYLAAINRFKVVADKFQQTSHLPESLLRLVESYLALGLLHEAQKAGAVLGHNYPGSEWYLDAYALLETKVSAKPRKNPTRLNSSAIADEPWYKFW
jgi:outer membrane protein assembly factor BamD